MHMENMHDIMLYIAGAVGLLGIVGLFFALRHDSQEKVTKQIGRPVIAARLEFNRGSGELFYVVENSGTGKAVEIQVYLPKCQEIALQRNNQHSEAISNSIALVSLQKYKSLKAGQAVETPIMQLPANEESVRCVTTLGLDAEIQWRDDKRGIIREDKILQVFIRKRSPAFNL